MANGNGDQYLDVWMKRLDFASKLVGNVGFPMIVSSALLYLIFAALPSLAKLNDTLDRILVEVATQEVTEVKLVDQLAIHTDEGNKAEQKILDELIVEERKMDQYHQDYMLGHRESLPASGE